MNTRFKLTQLEFDGGYHVNDIVEIIYPKTKIPQPMIIITWEEFEEHHFNSISRHDHIPVRDSSGKYWATTEPEIRLAGTQNDSQQTEEKPFGLIQL